MIVKPAETSVPIHDLLARRWSGRAFDPARAVTGDTLMALLEAARWAPSCFGDEPWRFIACDRNAGPGAWEKALECLVEGNRAWARHAPLLVLSVADSEFTHNARPNRFAQYDTGAAAMSLCIQATALGLMVHQMGGFDADRARTVFGVPVRFQPMAMMAVGYQCDPGAVPGELRERELGPRRRQDLGSRFFAGAWDRPFPG